LVEEEMKVKVWPGKPGVAISILRKARMIFGNAEVLSLLLPVCLKHGSLT